MSQSKNEEIIKLAVEKSLNLMDQKREREIIARRFGLFNDKETLEQIGDSLLITRERVRQLEKVVINRLYMAAQDGSIAELPQAEKVIIRNLIDLGRAARISDLADRIFGHPSSSTEQASIAFLGKISNAVTYLNANEDYHLALSINELGDERAVRAQINNIIKTIKKHGSVMTLDELDQELDYEHPRYISAIASLSKKLATLNGYWGLIKWPEVNPRNIRDKIYVILNMNGKPMHFTKIAEEIASSSFKRKDVTIQAIHNELIKDDRFVLIGRGIYALSEWGYDKGAVADIIQKILKESGKPLSKQEIIEKVLASRQVRTTTISLNLQNKKLFKKVGKSNYTLA